MMKAAWKTSVACLLFALALLYVWQYPSIPALRVNRSANVLGQASRAIFGDRCLDTYKIGNRQGAVAYARKIWHVEKIWQVERLKSIVLGDEDVTTSIFKSELFREGGDKDRDFNSAGWLAGRSGFDGWHVSYSVSNPTATAYLSAEFSDCGRVRNSASKIFKRPR
jgi:hypothetical protein